MTTLITGGTGFVGLNVAEALLGRGETVVLLDRAAPPPVALAQWVALPGRVEAVTADVREARALGEALKCFRVERVVHAAAITPNAERERRAPREIVEVNVLGTVAVLEALRGWPVSRLLVTSSVSVYGHVEPERGPLDEAETCPRPTSLYGIAKLAAESCALRADELDPLPVVAARLGPVFGPWERPTGARDMMSPLLQVTRLAAAGRPAVLAHAGEADWIYARDVAAGIVALLAAPQLGYRVYNVGAGRVFSVAAWCERLVARYPTFRWRLADGPGDANVRFQPPRPRAPLAIARVTGELAYRPGFDADAAFADFAAWIDRTPSALAGGTT
jgi:nucleoside-diphosphate-sugar epimerase